MTPQPYQYVLTPDEATRLDALAQRRNDHWRKKRVVGKKKGRDRGNLEIHRIGCYGEYACCQILGIPFNWADDHPDGHIDGVFEGKTVQIKSTVFGNRLLLFTDLEHFKADLGILCLVSMAFKTMRMVGWITREEYADQCIIESVTDYLDPQPQMDRDELHPPDTLVTRLVTSQPMTSFTEHLEDPEDALLSLPHIRNARARVRAHARLTMERERRALMIEADRQKKAWIQEGNETRQPPEYRGQVFDVADRDGVHPTAFPPLRDAPQEGLSDAFIDFQNHNQTRYETHPQYYCVECKIRYNARDGGRCGPCIGKDEPTQIRAGRKVQPPTEYPL